MNTANIRTQLGRSSAWAKTLGLVSLGAAAWALSAGQAQARGGHDDIYWSIGVHQPGVTVGVSNAPPPRPVVIHQPPPVVIHPSAPVVIHQPYPYVRPVVVHPRPVGYQGWGYGPRWDDRDERRHWKKKHKVHHHHHHYYHRDDDRWDDDGRRGGDRRR